jgi:hypothetical protein
MKQKTMIGALFPEKEYINGIFVTVWKKPSETTGHFQSGQAMLIRIASITGTLQNIFHTVIRVKQVLQIFLSVKKCRDRVSTC